jgi:chromate transporter
VAGGLFVLPSLVLLIVLSWIYVRFGSVPAVAAVLYGVKPAVVAIVLAAAWRIGSRTLHHWILWVIAAAAFRRPLRLRPALPARHCAAAALTGFAGASHSFRARSPSARTAPRRRPQTGPAVIDDDTPTPAHARYSGRPPRDDGRGVSSALWVLGLGSAGFALFGWENDFTQMGWFFTKAASSPSAARMRPAVRDPGRGGELRVAQRAADGRRAGARRDTPGPLIMIVAFVGFVGGWTKQRLARTRWRSRASLARASRRSSRSCHRSSSSSPAARWSSARATT